ncbi:hypothetical protein [Cryptosporangium arvum]|uniref:hypothetical protein n=1 Tax=Cryptosporangium arvum TaxID=80871 RepID=UPI0004B51355|nr:hypothetical protein [Cryptosporangium arvum]
MTGAVVAGGLTITAAGHPARANGRATLRELGRPVTRCVVADRRLGQISGLVERPGGFMVVNDTGPVVWRLDAGCRPIRRAVLRAPAAHDPNATPRTGKRFDTEDIALDHQNNLWIADIGGNTTYRTVVSLFRWRMGTASTAVTRFDLRYPDGAHDAEALLLARGGQVLIATKSSEPAGLYVADGPLKPTGSLRLAGRVDLRRACPDCRARSRLITGGAVSKDGTRAVLRTYDRAFEWYAPRGDLARVVTTQVPRHINLPESRQGEAIAYTADARTLLTATERIPAPIAAVPIRG